MDWMEAYSTQYSTSLPLSKLQLKKSIVKLKYSLPPGPSESYLPIGPHPGRGTRLSLSRTRRGTSSASLIQGPISSPSLTLRSTCTFTVIDPRQSQENGSSRLEQHYAAIFAPHDRAKHGPRLRSSVTKGALNLRGKIRLQIPTDGRGGTNG